MAGDAGIWGQGLDGFRAAVAGDAPTPGCGAVAAVAADLGLALVIKALRISDRHGADASRGRLAGHAQTLLERLGAYADEDVRAFARHLRADDADVTGAEGQAHRNACAVPLATAHACLEGLGLALAAWPLCAAALRSDVHAGALLLDAGLRAVLVNVEADAPALQDARARAEALQARDRLRDDAQARMRELQALLTDTAR
ncbi:cyclodeaminase/cyclohydrolase family protein [Coralloluteibacterium stylophorae]|uniref:Cyclodeaminase/cyclohydrolase family protein n=1 Tax=Coralloluteibacterium stylophorae TaxID=1776034 RepID=A0A8J7VRT8_9GAMM|nr:cyclodeaminase/cyclohydrolase family protein [Coralloluteibacterium stylophorae]MBS7455743.1 cyclodeaminase/cyclohydrolase family protein [Coralloluteibacterium stylophorae]